MSRQILVVVLFSSLFALACGCGRPSESAVTTTDQSAIDAYATPPGVAEDAAKAAAEAARQRR